MANITTTAFILLDVVLTLGADSYQSTVSQVEFTVSQNIIRWHGLGNNSQNVASVEEWAAVLTFPQDWETTGSLSKFLLENSGETVAATFKPKSGSGPSFTSTLTLVSPNIGGTVNAIPVTTVTLGATKPVLVPPA